MDPTIFGKSDALTQKIWSATLFKEAAKNIFLTKFMGESADNIVQVKNDLTKKKGDKITVGLRMRLTDPGQSGQSGISLEGKEESLVFYDFGVEITEYGHAVRAGSKIDLQRPAFDLRTEMKDALKEWVAEKIEKLLIAALVASPSSGRVIDDSLNALSVAAIQKAKRKAQLAVPKIQPIKVEGQEVYVMLIHPLSAKGLKADADWKNAQLYANIRGKDNPIFTGALGIIDGVVIHEYDRDDLLEKEDSTPIAVCKNVLLGAQAAVLAYAQYPSWLEKLFDYGRIPGVGTDMLAGVGKTVFNEEDYGTVVLQSKYEED